MQPFLGVLLALALGRAAPEVDPLFSEVSQISSFVGQGITALAIDVDGDGDQDLVSSEYSADTLVWYENNGLAPTIWTRRTIDDSAFGPQMVAAADFDGDGDVDALSPKVNDDSFAWYENDGASPPSWTRRIVSFVMGPWSVHTADIDGDGDVDGIGGVRLDTPDHLGVEWFDNNGGSPPVFTVRRISTGFVEAAAVHAADVDGDGDEDVLAVDVFRDRILLYENGGGSPPVWTERTVTTTTDNPFSVFAVDLDRDGDLDVLSASQDDDEVAWHENQGGTPLLWSSHTISSAPGAVAVFAIDLDGDADLDVVSGARENEVAWYESDGAVPPLFTKRVLSTDCAGEAVFAARLDPDADIDLLISCSTTGLLRWYPNHANFAESDGDGVRDALDCAPADASAFAVPREIEDARYETKASLAWSTAAPRSGPGTVYDILRGSIAALPVGSGGETCLGPGTAESIPETFVPPPAMGVYHLVRGRNACGDGTYGFSSSGLERTSGVCP